MLRIGLVFAVIILDVLWFVLRGEPEPEAVPEPVAEDVQPAMPAAPVPRRDWFPDLSEQPAAPIGDLPVG